MPITIFYMNLSINKNYGDTNFVTGMRAYAALAVVLIHTGGAGLRELGYVGNNFVDFCRTGVLIFFVISGFSVATSYKNSYSYLQYLGKRLLRIAPLYYFWLAFSIIFSATAIAWQENFGSTINVYAVVMHLSFLSFLDYRIANNIIGVEWSIPIEVFWYFFLPLMVIFSRSWNALVLMLASSLTIYVLGEAFATKIFSNAGSNALLALNWSPLPYFFSFTLGIAAYRLRLTNVNWGTISSTILGLSVMAILMYCYRPAFILRIFNTEFIFISLIAFLLILVGSKGNRIFNFIFCNRLISFLGVISYGIYLCHMPIFNLLNKLEISLFQNPVIIFLVVTFLAALASALTYFLIERPCSYLGNHIKGSTR